jgi:two-component sensor histidine kinase
MPTGTHMAKPGLGTGIVEALVRQLDAEVRIASADPGTTISISNVPEIHIVKSAGEGTAASDSSGGTAF